MLIVYGCGCFLNHSSGLCIAHGGGKRCQAPGCDKSARGATGFCKGHGGGKPRKPEANTSQTSPLLPEFTNSPVSELGQGMLDEKIEMAAVAT